MLGLTRALGLDARLLRRLAPFLLLAVNMMMVSVYGYTAASALFLARAGPERIPLTYVLMGLLSVPVFSGFSQLIDRLPRPALFQALLLLHLVAVVALRVLLGSDHVAVCYATYMVFFMAWVLLVDIMLPSLTMDYFTVTELKAAASLTAMAIAVGGLLGGGLALALSRLLSSEDLLLVVLVPAALGVLQVRWIDARRRVIEEERGGDEAGTLEALESFPGLVRRFPIILLLSASVFLFVVLNCIGEFLAFTLYSEAWPEAEDLAAFLGTLMAAQSVLQFGVIYFVSGPLVRRLGVVRMNLAYPLTTLASFLGLLCWFRLPAAVAANVNYDSLYQGVDKPVFNLNYNAVPHRFVGMVRVLGDGIFYSFGIAAAGALLMAANRVLDVRQVVLLGVGGSVVFLAVRVLVSRSYLKGLVALLRSGSVQLRDVGEGLASLPDSYAEAVREQLTSDDARDRLLGLEIAVRLRDPGLVEEEVGRALADESEVVRHAALRLVGERGGPRFVPHLRALLEQEDAALVRLALEGLLRFGERLADDEVERLLSAEDATVRVLARIVAHGAGRWEGRPEGLAAELAWAELDDAGRRDVVRALRATGAPELFLLAAPIAAPREPGTGVRTRVEAFRLMAEAAAPSHAAVMAPGLADSSRRVRAAAAAALARCGEAGRLAAEELLGSSRWYEAEGAALTLSLQHGRRAEEGLLESQRAVFSSVADGLRWSAALPAGDLRFDRLQVALGDLFRRSVDRTLLVLGGLGHERVVESARGVLHGGQRRLRADAVEALASLRRSGFVQPLLALLERWDAGQGAYVPAAAPLPPDRGPSEVLAEAVASPDRWVRIGAALTAAELGLEVPSGLDADADELVRRVAHALHEADGAAPAGRDHPMNRLFFLKKTELFGQLSLDDLLVIDGVTRQEDFLAGQVVCRQGTEGHELYVVYRGEVVVEREVDGEQVPVATLGPGEPLGEMALFDALPRSATVVAKTDCTLLVLQHRQFLHIAEQRPEILTEVARVLSHRIRKLEERLV